MGMKTQGSSKLTSKKRKELVLNLCQSLCGLDSPEDMAEALIDLLTPKEVETVAKRLQIAEFLVRGLDYDAIRNDLRVGYSTIARVNTWLNLSGKGYKLMFTKKKRSPRQTSDEERYDPLSWQNFKRRYSLYFWPQLLLEELLRISSDNE